MKILCIDPGSTVSGVVEFLPESWTIQNVQGEAPNRDLVLSIKPKSHDLILVEQPTLMGQFNAQQQTLDTCEWVGRIKQRAVDCGLPVVAIERNEIKLHLLGWISRKGHNPDSCIKEVMLARFPAGKGTKKNPGPLYGIAKHAWQALALGVTYWDKQKERK
jgi:hypothetical protein